MAAADDDDRKLHIVVFPWLAFGHMLPFLELSKSLATRGHRISYLTTPRNLSRLPEPPPHLSPLINFIPLRLPSIPSLPASAEATTDIPPDQVPYLKQAFDALETPISNLIVSTNPDWIIHDFAPHWLPLLASSSGVPCVFFSVFNAAFLSFLGSPAALLAGRTLAQLTTPPEWVSFPSNVAYHAHEARGMLEAFKPNASGFSDTYRIGTVIATCTAVAPRSCREIEDNWISLLQELYQKPVIPVGLLPSSAETRDTTSTGDHGSIMGWLDQQKPGSVVYVALGTEAKLADELIRELAFGLELAGIPFLWALRKQLEFLPEGFEGRTAERGVITNWAPQLKVLAHEAVGGFLTHCGGSSVVEGLQFGRPLVMLPIFVDQGLNARVMAEKGVGVEVERDEEDGMFTREAVARAVRMVVVEEEGEKFRRAAVEMREVFGDEESHERYVDDFAQWMIDHKNDAVA